MAIYLTTGKPGSFKTASTIEHGLKQIESGRLTFFCNFRGLKASEYNLSVLEHFNEWESIPDGSILYVDEVQEFTRDVPTNAKTEELPAWFTKLEKHRHRGIDIYINTQHPMFIHTHIRRLIEKHSHFQRTQGLPFAVRRSWGQVCNEPENIDNATIKKGCTTEVYRPNKDVFKYYESTVLDTHKFSIPPKLIKYGIGVFALVAFAVYMGSGVFQKYINTSDKPATDKQTVSNNTQNSQAPNTTKQTQQELSQLCRQASNVDLPECVQWFNSISDGQTSVTDDGVFRVKYNANNPYDDSFKQNINYEVTAKPIFSGCAKWNNKYYAYTQQGTKLNVSQADCQKLMSGDRPFNYFVDNKQNQNINNQQYQQQNTTNQTQQRSPQPVQMANNQVDPHLEAKVVIGANGS